MTALRSAVFRRVREALQRPGAPRPTYADRQCLLHWGEQHDGEALFLLGSMEQRNDRTVSYGLQHWVRAARLGQVDAMFELGCAYRKVFDEVAYGALPGTGNERITVLLKGAAPPRVDEPALPKSLRPMSQRARAIYWFRLAALQEHAASAATLAAMVHRAGDRYRALAVPWFEIAARNGDAAAAHALNAMQHGVGNGAAAATPAPADGAGVVEPPDAESWARMSQQELEQRAGGGDLQAMSRLIVLHEEAGEVAAAIYWMERAALAGNRGAALSLSRRYDLGLVGVAENPRLALHWTRHAACLGEPVAMFRHGEQLLTQEYGDPRPVDAYVWFRLATNPRFATSFETFRTLARARAEELAHQLTPEQLQEAESLVAACDGSPHARWPGAHAG